MKTRHHLSLAFAATLAGAVFVGPTSASADEAATTSGSIATPESGSAAGANALEAASIDPSTGIVHTSYRFDVETPRGNVSVKLGLDYSSAAGVGYAGYGWDLNVPEIHRVHPAGGIGAPTYTTPGDNVLPWDRFSFGGSLLVPLCIVGGGSGNPLAAGGQCPLLNGETLPSYATAGWVYFRPEVEGAFARFFLSPNRRTWIVEQQNGETLQLGAPLDNLSDSQGIDFDGKQIFQWNIVRRYDERGSSNQVTYRWQALGRPDMGFLTDIYDTPTGPGADPSTAAHRTHLDYDTPTVVMANYAPRWNAVPDHRLKVVTITSATFSSPARELVRRYHLEYLEGDYTTFGYYSLLGSVQLEGECASSIPEADALGNTAPVCPVLPATTFDYGGPLHSMTLSMGSAGPDPSANPILVDFNSDGLPDFITQSSTPSAPQNLYLNSVAAGIGTISRVDLSLSPSSLGGTTTQNFLTFDPTQTRWPNFGNWLGDGNIDVLWSNGSSCATYSGSLLGTTTGVWAGTVAPCYAQMPSSIPGGGKDLITLGDLDGDSLLDQIDCPPSPQTGPCVTQFTRRSADGVITPYGGARSSEGPIGAANGNLLISIPNQGCVDGDLAIASVVDMNGDGIGDLTVVDATLDQGDCTPVSAYSFVLFVYLGHGNGAFEPAYTPLGIPTPKISPSQLNFFLHDVNGDGLADFILNTAAGVTVAFGEPAANGTTQFSSPDTTFNLQGTLHGWDPNVCSVRAADMDGSGSDDIVAICPGGIEVKNFDSGAPARALQTISNGLGVTTQIDYETTTQLMIAARASTAWTSTTPQPMHVATRIQTRNHLPGAKEEVHGTLFSYANPVYDGEQQRLRGFRQVTQQPYEDNPAIPSNGSTGVQTSYLVGACDVDVNESCSQSFADLDRPLEALRGLPTLVETFSTSATTATDAPIAPHIFASTRAISYRLRRLYAGLDGRYVRFASTEQEDTFLYDTAFFVNAPQAPIALPGIDAVDDPNLSRAKYVAPRAVSSHLQKQRAVDDFGGATDTWNNGQINAQPADKPMHTGRWWQGYGPDGWWRRPTIATVDGENAAPGTRQTFVDYDAYGRPLHVYSILVGTLPLERHHADPAREFASSPPLSASHDGAVLLEALTYDAFGNLTHTALPDGECVDVEYDSLFSQLATSTTTYAGAAGGAGGCGTTVLTTSRVFDRGLEVATLSTPPTGATTFTQYDGLGRPTGIFRPSPFYFHETTKIAYEDIPGGPVQVQHVSVSADDQGTLYRDAWTFTDGFGHTVLSLQQADRYAGDSGDWIASGLPDRDGLGLVRQSYMPGFFGGAATTYPLGQSPSAWVSKMTYDAFGRGIASYETDGTQASRSVYHAMSVDESDARQISGGLPPTTYTRDGHGRVIRAVRSAKPDTLEVDFGYDVVGDLTSVSQVHVGTSDPPVVRWMQYDSLGRMVLNAEPNSSLNFSANPSNAAALAAWRYAYDDAGRLVGTSDARGCGENLYYDQGGRRLAEDYSPCLDSQPLYTPPTLTTGDGTEAFHVYDAPEPGQTTDYGGNPNYLVGALVASYDRSTHTRLAYDVRGRVTGVARQLAAPGVPPQGLASRYTPTWYRTATAYDDMDRPVTTSTGADAPELMGTDGASNITTTYSARGVVDRVAGSYGLLLDSQAFDSDGFLLKQQFGDIAATTGTFTPNGRRLVWRASFARVAPPLWTLHNNQGYTPPWDPTTSLQTDLADWTFFYGPTNEPTTILDGRKPYEWPPGAQPVSRGMGYDTLGRLTSVSYAYSTSAGTDSFVSPLQAEETSGDTNVIPFAKPANNKRMLSQTFGYDWLGNMKSSTDDSSLYWDRSVGTITNGTASAGPNQLVSAVGSANGSVNATYDGAGNLENLAVVRGVCAGTNVCAYRFVYDWDEVGHVARARRWDFTVAHAPMSPSHPPLPGQDAFTPAYPGLPPQTPAVDLGYTYDEGGWRVLKVRTAEDGALSTNAQIFSTLRLDGTTFDEATGDYEHSADTESVYFSVGGVAGRLLYAPSGVPSVGNPLHVLLELGDHLASTSVVIDKDTSELVERVTYQAYGQTESDYRPARWASYREKYRFTAMEDDVEVGLTYFGQRYYSAPLGRWISADPLTIHALGADANAYRYVGNSPLANIDAFGLFGEEDDVTEDEGGDGGGNGEVDDGEAVTGGGESGWSITIYPSTGGPGAASSGDAGSRVSAGAAPGNPLGFLCGDGPCQFGDARAMTPAEYGDEHELNEIIESFYAAALANVDAQISHSDLPPSGPARCSDCDSAFGGGAGIGQIVGGWVFDWFAHGQGVPEPVPGADEGGHNGAREATLVVGTVLATVFTHHFSTPTAGGLGGRSMDAIRQLGKEGELASGIVKNTERIASASNPGSYRIPDMLDHGAQLIGEVKNVGQLSFTRQLRDFASYAQANGYDFHLWVRSTTQLSGPLSAEVANGNIILNILP